MKSPIIPLPRKITEEKGTLKINKAVSLHTTSPLAQGGASLLEGYLSEINISCEENTGLIIHLNVHQAAIYDSEGFCNESYSIRVQGEGIFVQGESPEGLTRGIQSLRQMFLPQKDGTVSLPFCKIEDSPQYRWRGIHLDVARNFLPIEDLKSFIDKLALYKFNRLHIHLTDDQGWRLEIKRYPKLTSIASKRAQSLIGHFNAKPHRFDGKVHKGFYTQNEMKDILNFASIRGIEIVPELDIPGHSQATIAAYPELGCTDATVKAREIWGISQDILNPKKSTVHFFKNVLDEVCDLFPCKFIHIGGDEALKYQWENSSSIQEQMAELNLKSEDELQSWFIKQLSDHISDKGHRSIGWDEVLEGGLATDIAVMSWRGEEGGIQATKQGQNVVMAPMSHLYFDFYQDLPEKEEPLAIGGHTPTSKVYSYNPIPEGLSTEEAKFIMGAQGQLWTEYITSLSHLEYMAFPRACALAEILWSKEKSYSEFLGRLKSHREDFNFWGVNAHPRP